VEQNEPPRKSPAMQDNEEEDCLLILKIPLIRGGLICLYERNYFKLKHFTNHKNIGLIP
jgi:hypothetical protein